MIPKDLIRSMQSSYNALSILKKVEEEEKLIKLRRAFMEWLSTPVQKGNKKNGTKISSS